MIFLGETFLSGAKTLNYTPTSCTDINNIKVENGIIDDVFVTELTDYAYTTTTPSEWEYTTILHAKFNDSLSAGSAEFSSVEIDSLRIKVREKGKNNWTTIYDIPVSSDEDLRFQKFYNFNRNGVTYEFALVPVVGKVEGAHRVDEVTSEFDGIAIMTKDVIYGTDYNITKSDTKREKTESVVQPLDSKYPYIVRNSQKNCTSGTTQASFFKVNEYCEYQNIPSYDYRKDVTDFMSNKDVKVLKFDDGRIFMIDIIDEISKSENGHENNIIVSFNWVEVGDVNNAQDLYDNNLIDVNPLEVI